MCLASTRSSSRSGFQQIGHLLCVGCVIGRSAPMSRPGLVVATRTSQATTSLLRARPSRPAPARRHRSLRCRPRLRACFVMRALQPPLVVRAEAVLKPLVDHLPADLRVSGAVLERPLVARDVPVGDLVASPDHARTTLALRWLDFSHGEPPPEPSSEQRARRWRASCSAGAADGSSSLRECTPGSGAASTTALRVRHTSDHILGTRRS